MKEQVEMLTAVVKQLAKATRPNDEDFNVLLKQWSKEEALEELEPKPRQKSSLRLPER